MSKQIAQERFTEALFLILEETFEQVRGVYLDRGTSLFETLDTITAAEASIPVSATCASLAAQVDHVRFYLTVLEDSIQGKDISKPDWNTIWRTTKEVNPEEWQALKDHLKETYQRIKAMLKSFESWDGENEVGDSMAMVVHTAYHLGEIRQALCTLKG